MVRLNEQIKCQKFSYVKFVPDVLKSEIFKKLFPAKNASIHSKTLVQYMVKTDVLLLKISGNNIFTTLL